MTSYLTSRSRGPRSGRLAATMALAAAGVLAVTACNVSNLLDVETPNVISPGDVQSAAGADAVRLGAIARLNAATSGGSSSSEGLFLLSGLFADEWSNGDSFIDRWQVDGRVITPQNSFLTDVNRMLHRARLSATQAVQLLEQYKPTGAVADVAEMYFIEAYVENLVGEHYCNGLVFSTVVNGTEQYGSPTTTTAAFEMALAHADSGLALITGSTPADVKVRNALQVTRGRILLNLNRPADAAAAVAGVPTAFQYLNLHSQTTNDNAMWTYNTIARRYSVGDREGGTGLDFATAKDPRVPVCLGSDAACKAIGVPRSTRDDGTTPLYVQMIWTTRDAPVAISDGIEARLIEAEAQLNGAVAGDWLATLNALRTDGMFDTQPSDTNPAVTDTLWHAGSGGVAGLKPLSDPGTAAARVDLLFRERAFWLFGRGHRVGDLRRLIRQYGRQPESVFPTGDWRSGSPYGTQVAFPVPQAEQNNPNVAGQGCMNNDA
ncbi:MAG: hypothetical protein IRY91_01975 [Gemmatimonadaceae bacterium]|nr:hypothetical protein [Gemmatimonadaceae bacterium]